jgi:hypothetical protein
MDKDHKLFRLLWISLNSRVRTSRNIWTSGMEIDWFTLSLSLLYHLSCNRSNAASGVIVLYGVGIMVLWCIMVCLLWCIIYGKMYWFGYGVCRIAFLSRRKLKYWRTCFHLSLLRIRSHYVLWYILAYVWWNGCAAMGVFLKKSFAMVLSYIPTYIHMMTVGESAKLMSSLFTALIHTHTWFL